LLSKLDNASGEVERLREEKEQEIMILQEGMDNTIQQLSEAQQVGAGMAVDIGAFLIGNSRIKAFRRMLPTLRSIL
jgi:hypothetical protein